MMKNMTKKKPQVTKKNIPKWIPPEKRMKTYEDFGIVGHVPQDSPKWKKVKWIDFRIIVPDQYTKDQLLAAFEYLHDNKLIDTDFIAVNAVVHAYETLDNTNPPVINPILVDPEMLYRAKQETCPHFEITNVAGMNYCVECKKGLSVTTYRD